MMTSLAIDDKLLKEAQSIGRHRTKKETVTEALKEYIKHMKQMEILELFGTIDYDANYDYKKARNRK
ncbi:MAG TPA: type II toxin-antitoxin system VapB family antitoxin [Candidatus Deferrimicrobium sp.]|nr:type II toxin-antitoxin system VapB family antitoxin [Candidatus Deferrimicrobium sp.]